MSKIISVWNNKGGVGKTTTTLMLGQMLSKRKKKVLLIDLDPQCNLTKELEIFDNDICQTSYDMIMNTDIKIDEVIKNYNGKEIKFDYIPGDIKLQLAPNEILLETMKKNPNERVKKEVDKIRDLYDYIFIDSSPTIDILTTNILVASDEVISPIKADRYSIEGIKILINTINEVKENFNPTLKFKKVFLNMYQKSKVDDKVYEYLINNLDFMANTKISNAVAIKENTLEECLFLERKIRNKKIIPQFEELVKELEL